MNRSLYLNIESIGKLKQGIKWKAKGQRSVVFKIWACLSILCIRQGWTMSWTKRNEANLYLLSCFWEPLQPSPPLPLLGNLTCSTVQEQLGQKCLLLPQPGPAPAQRGRSAWSSLHSARQTPHSPVAPYRAPPALSISCLMMLQHCWWSVCQACPIPLNFPRSSLSLDLLKDRGKWRLIIDTLCILPAWHCHWQPWVHAEKHTGLLGERGSQAGRLYLYFQVIKPRSPELLRPFALCSFPI